MPEKLGRFELLKKIATGGMAELFLAKQRGIEGFEKLVVIKRLLPEVGNNKDFVQLFLNEARIAARLNHPNVAQIYDLGFADGNYYIAMEYVQGENLSVIHKTCHQLHKPIPLEHALKIVMEVCEGLHYAHTKTDTLGTPLHIVHCDISPHNILVSFEGIVKVVDFGVAKAATKRQQADSSAVIGKPGYMSPEQILNRPLDARTDIFSLGIIFWELITSRRLLGNMPWTEKVKHIVKTKFPSPRKANPEIDESLAAIVLKTLEKEPEKRFQDASQLHVALGNYIKETGLTSTTFLLSKYMHGLFPEKLQKLKQIEEAREAGDLGDFLFEGIEFEEQSRKTPTGLSGVIEELRSDPKISRPKIPKSTPSTYARLLSWLNKRTIVDLIFLFLVLCLGFVSLFSHSHFVTKAEQWIESIADLLSSEVSTESIQITSDPAGASVSVDGIAKGITPCEISDLEIGKVHSVDVYLTNFIPWSDQFTLKKGDETRRLHATLTPLVIGKWGKVKIITQPPGAKLELDGKPIKGVTPMTIEQVSADQPHKIKALLSGREPWTRNFRVKEGEQISLNGVLPRVVRPEETAPTDNASFLSITSNPQAVVFVDHVQVGSTPLEDHVISPGSHLVDLVNKELNATESFSIQTTVGESIEKNIVFRKGLLEISSEPEAEVYIGGQSLGKTPLTKELYVGEHELTLKNPTLNLIKKLSFKIKPQETTKLDVSLTDP